jgi:hypothetical protein
MSVSYPSSTHLLLCIQSTSSHTPECFRFHPWNSSPAEWRCTPDRRRLYRMLWGKPPAEWCSLAEFGSHVSLFPVPIFGVNSTSISSSFPSVDRAIFFSPLQHRQRCLGTWQNSKGCSSPASGAPGVRRQRGSKDRGPNSPSAGRRLRIANHPYPVEVKG